MPRLFTGIDLPEHLREQLFRLRMPCPGARWVEPENLHITLRFIGDVDNIVARDFHDALAVISEHAFEVRLKGLGAFGGNQPRAIWAGVEAGPELEMLARANERAARIAGLPPEKHAFVPHVTLARLKYGRPEMVARVLERHGAYRSESFYVDRFTLFSSKPLVGGGPYVIESEFPLMAYGSEDGEDHFADEPWR